MADPQYFFQGASRPLGMTRKLAINAALNVGGQVVSAGVGLVSLPWLLHLLGATRLGLFTLALGLIGFSGIFDFGLSRALTHGVSSALGEGRANEHVAGTTWRVIFLLVLFGCVWAGLLWWLTPYLVAKATLPDELAAEATLGLHSLALSVPFSLGANGQTGALEGLQKFRLLNAWRIPMSVLQFGLPLLAATLTADTGWVIAALAATRVIAFILWARLLHGFLPFSRAGHAVTEDVVHVLKFGGWLSVSNLTGSIMMYADRFYLASLFPPAAVAHYTVPFDVATRVISLPQTAMNALFPALAAERSRPDYAGTSLVVALQAIIAILLPALVIAVVFAHALLSRWLDASFALDATPIFQVLVIGVLLNAVAHPPYAFLQAMGRSDLTAQLHLAELPIFIAVLFWAVGKFGLAGAALAWTVRVGIDAILLFLAAGLLFPRVKRVFGKALGWISLTCLALVAAIMTTGTIQALVAGLTWAGCVWLLADLWHRWRGRDVGGEVGP